MSDRVRALRGKRLRRRTRDATAGSALISGALIIGLVGGGGTFALWNDDTTLPDGELQYAVDEGEVSLQFAVGSPVASAVDFTNLLPGESKTIPVLLENTGDQDLDILAELTETTGTGYALRLAIDDACVESGFLASPYQTDFLLEEDDEQVDIGAIDEGATAELCVQVTADSTITTDSTMTFQVTLVGSSD
jgi:predicted ribosomally synthesized peptide with SipW-like signal peptide